MWSNFLRMFKSSKMVLRVRSCPFCNSSKLILRKLEDTGLTFVNCASCCARGPLADGELESIKRWNRMATKDEP
jgi:hypothetical protein